MIDRHGRKINYLRISVTDRCNLRCVYCMPPEGINALRHQDILTLEEIACFARIAAEYGIDKVRLTGGEPLVRKNVVYLVRLLKLIGGIKDLSLTTNGVLLEEYAKPLKDAGLLRVNVSLDTVDPEKFRTITRGGDIVKVFRGIDAAERAGLLPIKINCVVKESSSEPEAERVKEFCERRGFSVRFIHQMSLEEGRYGVVEGGTGGNCRMCNKLRLSSDGNLRPCLFDDAFFNVRDLGPETALRMAVEAKPECGTRSSRNRFNIIGG